MEQMDIQVVKIDKLRPMENNIRKHNEKQIKELQRSFKAFGQIRPAVVDENFTILAGHGLWMALKDMGEDTIKVLQMLGLSETEKKKVMIADNRIYEMGTNNFEALMIVLEEIKIDEETFDIPGVDDSVISQLFADIGDIDETIKGYGAISDEKIEELKAEKQKAEDNEGKQINKPRELELNPDIIQVEQKTPSERPKPYVVCPKCGERIWL